MKNLILIGVLFITGCMFDTESEKPIIDPKAQQNCKILFRNAINEGTYTVRLLTLGNGQGVEILNDADWKKYQVGEIYQPCLDN